MKAEDTVIGLELVNPKFPDYIPCAVWDVLSEQAEISFEAGMRKVVGWIKEHNAQPDEILDMWQAQLKEWGIK